MIPISESQKRNRSLKNPSRHRNPNERFPIRTRTRVLPGNLPKPSKQNLKTAPTGMPTTATILTRCSTRRTAPSLAKRNRPPPKNRPLKRSDRPLHQVYKNTVENSSLLRCLSFEDICGFSLMIFATFLFSVSVLSSQINSKWSKPNKQMKAFTYWTMLKR